MRAAAMRDEVKTEGGRDKAVGSKNSRRLLLSAFYLFHPSSLIPHPFLSRFFIQFISDAAHRQHVMGILRISFELLAKAIDVWINVSLVTFVLCAPDLIEQRIARPCATRL